MRPAVAAGRPAPREGEALALGAAAFLLVVTAAWWAVALWPVAGATPAWLQTARAVCFGAHDDGLPGAGGWILLVGEPVGMMVALYALWRRPLASGVRRLAWGWGGRLVLASVALAVAAGLGAAGWRVADASAGVPEAFPTTTAPVPRDGPAPALRLVDQHGEPLTLGRFRGRPVLVTFAFAHCETVCPLLVHDALRARAQAAGTTPALVVVTLDPWRDTPARLPHLAAAWRLDGDAFVGGGSVEEVEATLAAWGVARSRDPRTGEVAHAPATYVVDAAGRLRFFTTGRREELAEALRRL